MALVLLAVFELVFHPPSQAFAVSRSECPHRRCLTDQLVLSRINAVTGTPIHADLIVTNLAKRVVVLSGMCRPGYAVVLVNRRIDQTLSFNLECVASLSVTIAPGSKSFPLTIQTRYLGCVKNGQETTATVPPCLPEGGPPPLPPGLYRAVLLELGVHFPQPKPVSVMLFG